MAEETKCDKIEERNQMKDTSEDSNQSRNDLPPEILPILFKSKNKKDQLVSVSVFNPYARLLSKGIDEENDSTSSVHGTSSSIICAQYIDTALRKSHPELSLKADIPPKIQLDEVEKLYLDMCPPIQATFPQKVVIARFAYGMKITMKESKNLISNDRLETEGRFGMASFNNTTCSVFDNSEKVAIVKDPEMNTWEEYVKIGRKASFLDAPVGSGKTLMGIFSMMLRLTQHEAKFRHLHSATPYTDRSEFGPGADGVRLFNVIYFNVNGNVLLSGYLDSIHKAMKVFEKRYGVELTLLVVENKKNYKMDLSEYAAGRNQVLILMVADRGLPRLKDLLSVIHRVFNNDEYVFDVTEHLKTHDCCPSINSLKNCGRDEYSPGDEIRYWRKNIEEENGVNGNPMRLFGFLRDETCNEISERVRCVFQNILVCSSTFVQEDLGLLPNRQGYYENDMFSAATRFTPVKKLPVIFAPDSFRSLRTSTTNKIPIETSRCREDMYKFLNRADFNWKDSLFLLRVEPSLALLAILSGSLLCAASAKVLTDSLQSMTENVFVAFYQLRTSAISDSILRGTSIETEASLRLKSGVQLILDFICSKCIEDHDIFETSEDGQNQMIRKTFREFFLKIDENIANEAMAINKKRKRMYQSSRIPNLDIDDMRGFIQCLQNKTLEAFKAAFRSFVELILQRFLMDFLDHGKVSEELEKGIKSSKKFYSIWLIWLDSFSTSEVADGYSLNEYFRSSDITFTENWRQIVEKLPSKYSIALQRFFDAAGKRKAKLCTRFQCMEERICGQTNQSFECSICLCTNGINNSVVPCITPCCLKRDTCKNCLLLWMRTNRKHGTSCCMHCRSMISPDSVGALKMTSDNEKVQVSDELLKRNTEEERRASVFFSSLRNSADFDEFLKSNFLNLTSNQIGCSNGDHTCIDKACDARSLIDSIISMYVNFHKCRDIQSGSFRILLVFNDERFLESLLHSIESDEPTTWNTDDVGTKPLFPHQGKDEVTRSFSWFYGTEDQNHEHTAQLEELSMRKKSRKILMEDHVSASSKNVEKEKKKAVKILASLRVANSKDTITGVNFEKPPHAIIQIKDDVHEKSSDDIQELGRLARMNISEKVEKESFHGHEKVQFRVFTIRVSSEDRISS